jgi:P-type Cu2+ transporter
MMDGAAINSTPAPAAMCGPVGVCQHCGEALGARAVALLAAPDMAHAWFCCIGCRVANAWSQPDALAADRLPVAFAPAAFSHWDQSDCLTGCEHDEDGGVTVCLAIDAIYCPNCAWLIETSLHRLAPEVDAIVDVPLRLLHLKFYPSRHPLSALIAALAALDYPARLISAGRETSVQRQSLKQLFVAGFCAVQAMMFAEPLYWSGTDLPPQTAVFFAWLSALITVPVVGYSGARFFRGARTELRLHRPGMDTLISLSIVLALLGSTVGLLRGSAAVYFDAIAMFVFVLLLGRMLEFTLMARARALAVRLNGSVPTRATRADGTPCAVSELKVGDRLSAAVGELLVADGVLESNECALSAALLDGEFAPKFVVRGAPVFAGASVRSGACIYRVTALGGDSQIGHIARLSRRAGARRLPNAAEEARLATRFTFLVLTLALLTAAAWWWIEPSRALSVTLSVLTVACPCALGLALPLTRAVAHARLQRMGVILLKPDVLERSNRVDCVLLDKTGTLTAFAPVDPVRLNPSHLADAVDALTVQLSGGLSRAHALALAAALERGQNHPWAQALTRANAHPSLLATDVDVLPGVGIRGTVLGQRWRLGSPAWFGLADDGSVILDGPDGRAHFALEERLLPSAVAAVAALRTLNVDVEILSGDSRARVENVAQRLGIAQARYRQSPTQKHAAVQALLAAGRYPLMLGDGVNDAIALASAHVAVSLGVASALAHANADVLMVEADLTLLPELICTARRAHQIAQQNLYWAQGYNLVAIPLAALGMIGPGWAALGMGLSSLLVTLNAARLWRSGPIRPIRPIRPTAEHAPVSI